MWWIGIIPSFALLDHAGKTRAVLGGVALERDRTGSVEQRAESLLVLFDRDGKVIWKAP